MNFDETIDYLGSQEFWDEVKKLDLFQKEIISDNLLLASTHINSLIRREYIDLVDGGPDEV